MLWLFYPACILTWVLPPGSLSRQVRSWTPPNPGPGPKPGARSGPKSISTSERRGFPSHRLLLPIPAHLQGKVWSLVFFWSEVPRGAPACPLGQSPAPSYVFFLLHRCTTLCRAWVLQVQLLFLNPSSSKSLESSSFPNADKHLSTYLLPSHSEMYPFYYK